MPGYKLSERAKQDLRKISLYTREAWGAEQEKQYRQDLRAALKALGAHPGIGHPRDELAPGLRSFKVGQHIAYYLENEGGIEVARILHPSMEIERHIAPEKDQE